MQPRIVLPIVSVTVITSSKCSASRQLIDDLAVLISTAAFKIDIFDVMTDQIPDFAQSLIVPATYIGETLWRYGRYPLNSLEARVVKEQSAQLTNLPK